MTSSQKKTETPASWISHLDAHHRFLIACPLGIIAFFVLQGHTSLVTQFVTGWDVYATITLGLAWIVMGTQDPYQVRRNASLQDASQKILFMLVVSAAVISVVAVFVLLGTAKSLSSTLFALHITLAMSTVGLSWALVHTLFAIRYAHYYYIEAHQQARDKIDGGLMFPNDTKPDYLDFAYFSFVIGMTCQVSDVQISSKTMRRLATVHGLICFAFNTAILAIFVNIVAGLV